MSINNSYKLKDEIILGYSSALEAFNAYNNSLPCCVSRDGEACYAKIYKNRYNNYASLIIEGNVSKNITYYKTEDDMYKDLKGYRKVLHPSIEETIIQFNDAFDEKVKIYDLDSSDLDISVDYNSKRNVVTYDIYYGDNQIIGSATKLDVNDILEHLQSLV